MEQIVFLIHNNVLRTDNIMQKISSFKLNVKNILWNNATPAEHRYGFE